MRARVTVACLDDVAKLFVALGRSPTSAGLSLVVLCIWSFCGAASSHHASPLLTPRQVHREVREGRGQVGPGAVGSPLGLGRPRPEAVPAQGAHGPREPHRHHVTRLQARVRQSARAGTHMPRTYIAPSLTLPQPVFRVLFCPDFRLISPRWSTKCGFDDSDVSLLRGVEGLMQGLRGFLWRVILLVEPYYGRSNDLG